MKIGIRAEDKNQWERRVPLIPADIAELRRQDILIQVQSSVQRAYTDKEFKELGIPLSTDLKSCGVIIGLKEVPIERLEAAKVYFIFSHVIKGQAYNMPMLKHMMTLGTTLVDYERVVDSQDRRLIFFGRHAGLAGMINTLWALGQRLNTEDIANPLSTIRQAKTYRNLSEARKAIQTVAEKIERHGIPDLLRPLTVGFLGYGNVSRGAQEIFDLLPFREVAPSEIGDLAASDPQAKHVLYKTIFKEKHMVASRDHQQPFDLQDYYRYGAQKYRGTFQRHLNDYTLLINCNYWDTRYPRAITRAAIKEIWARNPQPKLKVIGDISCDIEGAVECTLKPTYPEHPVYVYHPDSGQISDGFSGHGPVIMAVEILPTELPRESSAHFSAIMKRYMPSISSAHWKRSFEALDLPPELKRAVILHKGRLTPEYAYLASHIEAK